jgi:multisubunit Na+/H+ antiporter MnhB subunit
MVTLSNQLGSTAMATFVGLFWVVVHILGMVIAAIALRRARVLPLWAAILLGLSQPVHLVAAIIVPSRWLDVLGGWGMTTLICGYVALQVLRTRNEDWDLPRLRA